MYKMISQSSWKIKKDCRTSDQGNTILPYKYYRAVCLLNGWNKKNCRSKYNEHKIIEKVPNPDNECGV